MNSKRPAAAFTLLELLVSCAVLAVLLLAAADCVQHTARATSHARRSAEAQRQLRFAARVLREDFQHAAVSAGTPLWLNPPPEIWPTPDRSPAAGDGAALFFTHRPAFGKSELCAAGYYLTATRQLRRYFKNSDTTWRDTVSDSGFLPHMLDPAKPLFPDSGGAARNETLLLNVSALSIRALRADASPIADSPLTVRPALLEITVKLREREPAHEFIIGIAGP